MVKSMVLRELHTLEETTMDKVRFLMSDTGAPFTAACREALEQKGVDVTVVEKDGNKVLQKMLTVRPQVCFPAGWRQGHLEKCFQNPCLWLHNTEK